MEEKKTRFSVKEWEANPKRRVVTNTGKDVRILCVDRIGGEKILPVVALVLCEGAGSRAEALCEFDADGIQNGNKNGWILYFKETYADVLEDELLANGFRLIMEKSEERTFYKTINAGKENRYDIFVTIASRRHRSLVSFFLVYHLHYIGRHPDGLLTIKWLEITHIGRVCLII